MNTELDFDTSQRRHKQEEGNLLCSYFVSFGLYYNIKISPTVSKITR
jgi:hypothetical protein